MSSAMYNFIFMVLSFSSAICFKLNSSYVYEYNMYISFFLYFPPFINALCYISCFSYIFSPSRVKHTINITLLLFQFLHECNILHMIHVLHFLPFMGVMYYRFNTFYIFFPSLVQYYYKLTYNFPPS